MEGAIKATPDMERAKNLLEMVDIRLESIKLMENSDARKFTSKIIEEYYEALLELVTAIMSIDGYKTTGGTMGTHIASINYMRKYEELGEHEINLMDDMRKKRIGIKYYGRHINMDYMVRKEKEIRSVISKLKSIAIKKYKKG